MRSEIIEDLSTFEPSSELTPSQADMAVQWSVLSCCASSDLVQRTRAEAEEVQIPTRPSHVVRAAYLKHFDTMINSGFDIVAPHENGNHLEEISLLISTIQ